MRQNKWQRILSLHALILSLLFFSQKACAQRSNDSKSPTHETSGFSLVAIGDAGEKNDILENNAETMTELFRSDRFNLLLFLGDNFYRTGLNFAADKDPQKEVPKKIKNVLGPFREVMQALGRQNVHAIAGNHDYYSHLIVDKSFLLGLFSFEALPVGITNKGNQRADAISSWTYHYGLAEHAFFPVGGEPPDSLQIIFFDSAILLRTKPRTWRPYLAQLQQLLASTKNRPLVKWRIIAAHHPLYSVGEHGGYSEWDPETRAVQYLNHCDADSNAVNYFFNLVDPEDLCAERYRAYRDSVLTAIQHGGAPVQLVLSGHDHSLQLLSYPHLLQNCPNCPKIHLISGAGAKENPVKTPNPARGEYTCPDNDSKRQGKSRSGFARLDFQGERLRVRFFSGQDNKEIDMGGGRKEFLIKSNGTLEAQ